MNRSNFHLVVALALAAFLLPGSSSTVQAEGGPLLIRYASLAPGPSAFGKILKAWARTLKKETDGRVELRLYSGGSQGDERDFIRKMRAGQMDAAGISTTGLGLLVRPTLVLAVPGVIKEYKQLDAVRAQVAPKLKKLFEDAGLQLVTWGVGGKNRIFSTRPFSKPEDLKSGRPWVWKDDPVFDAFIKAVGANPVRLGVPEVYPSLQTKMVDTVPASAITAVAMQWYTRLKYMANDNFNIILGGSVINQSKFDQMTKEDQAIFIDSGIRAGHALDKIVMKDDGKAYKSLLNRGLQLVDVKANAAAWDAAAKKARRSLVGRVYSKDLLALVEGAAK